MRSTAAPATAPTCAAATWAAPNLLRSQLVLNDQHGELILPVVKNGRQNPGMPPMPPLPLADDDVKAIAEYIHSVAATMRGQGAPPPGADVELNILVGDAEGGQSVLRGEVRVVPLGRPAICRASRRAIADPLQLQNPWVAGGGGRGRGGAPAARRRRAGAR